MTAIVVDDIKTCTKCPELVKCRQQVVCGEGPSPCDIMYIARNPGRDEDKQGRPLVGTAGSMAMWLLYQNGFKREEVYLTNVVKCWTPGDRTPYEREIESCRLYLVEEIQIVRPRIIVASGREAISFFAPYLEGKYKAIEASARGPVGGIRGIPFSVKINDFTCIVVGTYHPSFVSRTQHITKKDAKKKLFNGKPIALADIALAKEILENGWQDKFVETKTFSNTVDTTLRQDCAFDLETTGLNPHSDRIIGFAISEDGKHARSYTDISYLGARLSSPAGRITQNGCFDYRFAKAAGIKPRWTGNEFDTMFAAHALHPDLLVNLGFLNSLHTHYPPWKSKTKGKMHDTVNMDQTLLHERCCYDAAATYSLSVVLRNDLQKAGLYESPFRRLYMPMLPIITEMMYNGVKFDQDLCDKRIVYFYPQFKALQDKWIKEGVDLGSPKQIGERLVADGVVLTKRGKTQWTVDDEVLGEIRKNVLVDDVRLYRKLQKILTTDLIGMRKRVGEDGYLRSDLDLTGTGTGRFSSTDPDLQNIRLALRDMFVTRDGYYLFGLDYKGMELYVAALLAGDHELVKEMDNGRDPLEEQRRHIYGAKPSDDILAKTQRTDAKTYVYGPLYGKTKYSIAVEKHVTQADAERYLAVSCTQRPKFAEWRNLQSELAYGSGAVYSAYGRRRLLFADRIDTQAYNSPVQMTAHDIVLETMIMVYKELGLIPWMQVHDSILWELPGGGRDIAARIEDRIEEIATRPIKELNNHRFRVETGRGKNWKQVDIGEQE